MLNKPFPAWLTKQTCNHTDWGGISPKICTRFCSALFCCDCIISFFYWFLWYIYSPIFHYSNVIMGAIASQITNPTIIYSTVYSGADQRKHQSSASLAFVRGIHRWPVNSPHKWPVTRKMFPFDDVIILQGCFSDTGAIFWLPQCQWNNYEGYG